MSDRKIRLLITASEFMHNSAVRNICDVVKGLDLDVFEVEVGALSVGDEATSEIVSLGVPVFKVQLLPSPSLDVRKHMGFLLSPWVIARKRYDLVHSFLWQSQAFEPLILKAFSKAKYIYTKSNLAWNNHPIHWHLKSRLADRIVSISKATDDILGSHGFAGKIRKIPHGIDTDYFQESMDLRQRAREQWRVPRDAMVFGCVAQFVEWKEHLTVLAAFERLVDTNNDLYLLFCGPRTQAQEIYYKEFMRRFEDSPVKERVRILGTLSDMPAFYSAIDCFVLVSRFEPFGYVYIEAMACKRPVIACNAAGPAEIVVPGETGLFAEMSNPKDLAHQMDVYARNRVLMQSHGCAARQRVLSEYSGRVMALRTQELYLEALQVGGVASRE